MHKFLDKIQNKEWLGKLEKNKPMQNNKSRVLAIGDLHEPFSLDKYFDFCCGVYEYYECDTVVFIGDIVDNCFSNYHEIDPDGFGAKKELGLAIRKLRKWYNKFPDAKVITGNHDRLPLRKARSGLVSEVWIKEYNEVLGVQNWEFMEQTMIDNVLYCHGEGKEARTRIKDELVSIVQGHRHSLSYCYYMAGETFRIFGMQTGCGVDRKAYSMAYGKHFQKPFISCGVIIDGYQAITVPMKL